MSQLGMVLSWWLALQLFGLAALPLTLRLFRNLPDRGWAFARPVGLLSVGYLFWMGGTIGLLGNDGASIFGALIVLGIVSWLLCWPETVGLPALVRAQRPRLLAIELLFTVAFLLWTLVRAYNPEISATEKPMELAFLNGVLRSDQFPPIDPWLSGFSISYYYFGYVITGMLARFTAVPAQFAFNLMLPTLFALTATGAYAIGTNLYVGARLATADGRLSTRRTVLNGLLAVALVLLLSNLEPVLEILNAHRALPPAVGSYFAIKDMPPPYESSSLFPREENGWWWFRATRVIGTTASPDQPTARDPDYTINEFPFFSFMLGDMHPHVLALPFIFAALGFALNLLRSNVPLSFRTLRRDPWMVIPAGVLFGALGFLNAWDMPTFVFVLAGALAIQRLLTTGALTRPVVRDVIYSFLGALLIGILFYLPFYLAFRSQASGLLPVVTHTQMRHFLLFWGPLYGLTATFLIALLAGSWRLTAPGDWTRSRMMWGGTLLLAVATLPLEAPVVGLTLPLLVAALALASRCLITPSLAPTPIATTVPPETTAARRSRARPRARISGGALPLVWPREHLFALLLAFTGLLLLLGCELVFIRDLFGNRMNTVFKLYYQAWILLALAGSYAIPFLWSAYLAPGVPVARSVLARGASYVLTGVLGLLFGLSLLYPYGATASKAHHFAGPPTLDGLAFWGRIRPEDMAAIDWLNSNVSGAPVVVEATGGSYRQEFGRVSSMTGLPTLLGWDFHEQQWRGSYDEIGRRKPDIEQIYRSPDRKLVLDLMTKYNASYLYVGPSERETYELDRNKQNKVDLTRFGQFMDVAFKNGAVTIYRVRGGAR